MYAAAGGYDVTLKGSANGCNAQITKRAVQFAKPVASFVVDNNDCNSKEASFKSTSTISIGTVGHVWDFGDGGKGSVADPTHIYQSFGTKIVRLRVNSEFGCSDSTSMSFTLKESPKVEFSSGKACSNDPVVFTNNTLEPSGSVTIYKWYFGDGDSSSSFSASHKYAKLGAKNVTLIANSDNGCSGSFTRTIEVKLQPIADFTAPNVCAGNPVKFTNSSKIDGGLGLSYEWTFGDGNTSTDVSPDHMYSASSTTPYTVTLVATIPGACSDSAVKQVKVYALPNCNFQAQNTGHKTWIFTPAAVTDLTYHWLFGDGAFSDAQIPTYKYPAVGEYKVTLVATTIEGNCTCSKTMDLSVNLGLKEPSSEGLAVTVYPNPNKGEFSISVEGNTGKTLSIEVFNVLGEKVKTIQTNYSTNGVYEVEMGDLVSGVYLVKVDNGSDVITKKITVSR
jgi:PKD repeat protein